MPAREKRYCTYLTRGLLLAGYLFLLGSQFNYRYYSIANFYVYGSNSGIRANAAGAASIAANEAGSGLAAAKGIKAVVALHHSGVAIINQKRHQNHLSIDKRFRFQHGVRVPQIRAPGVVCYTLTTIGYKPLIAFFSSTELPTNSLRGPPQA